jgi:short-subunit dehydrogenase
MKIDGAVCIVTGASSGIGAATAEILSRRGARVVLAARRVERLDALSAQLPNSLAVATDVTVPQQFQRLVFAAVEKYGRIDVLVNNAGQGLHLPLEELEPADLRAVFELNVVAPLVGLQTVLPYLRAQSAGAIINVSSATTLRVFAGLGGYSATKAALNMLSQVARVELASSGVSVSLVYPSVTATEFHDRLRAGQMAVGARNIPKDPPQLAGEAIAFAIETGEPHVLVADPPRAIIPGDKDAWSALLARQGPGAGTAPTP